MTRVERDNLKERFRLVWAAAYVQAVVDAGSRRGPEAWAASVADDAVEALMEHENGRIG